MKYLVVVLGVIVVGMFFLLGAVLRTLRYTREHRNSLIADINRLEDEVDKLKSQAARRPGRCMICNRFVKAGRDLCDRCLSTYNITE